jgi:hypothetical protein
MFIFLTLYIFTPYRVKWEPVDLHKRLLLTMPRAIQFLLWLLQEKLYRDCRTRSESKLYAINFLRNEGIRMSLHLIDFFLKQCLNTLLRFIKL